MQKTELCEDIIRFTFDPLPHLHFGDSIVAILDGSRVLLIDAAYEPEAMELLKALDASGLKVDSIILSHFHDDHMQGLKVLPKVSVYGSSHYQTTLDMWNEKEEHPYFIPSDPIKDACSFDFGSHHIDIIPLPGHSLCTVLTMVDNRYVHIADELMFSPDGRPLLPSVDGGNISRHIDSLRRLKDFKSYTLLPAHGPVLTGSERIEKEIDDRIAYFSTVLGSDRKLSYEEAVKDCDCDFVHSEWHKYIYE